MTPTLYVVVLTTTFLMLVSLLSDLFSWVYLTNKTLLIPIATSTILIIISLVLLLRNK
jgi:uncharacterized membrane protein YdcZ (DUF606 family)